MCCHTQKSQNKIKKNIHLKQTVTKLLENSMREETMHEKIFIFWKEDVDVQEIIIR